MTNLTVLANEIHRNAVKHGWYEDKKSLAEVLVLVTTEIAEAFEEYRNGHEETEVYFKDGKMEGIPVELADIIIRVLDYCGYLAIDIDMLVKQKMEYNKTRPYKHGGKRC